MIPEVGIDRMKDYINSPEYFATKERLYATLTRPERREWERREEKIKKCINSMTPMHHELINELANMRANEKIEEFRGILDRCISAFLIEQFPNKTWEEICKLEDDYGLLVLEDIEKTEKLVNKLKGEKSMGKVAEKYESEVRNKVNELLEKGVHQKPAIEELVSKFPMLSKSMLVNAYKKMKSDWDKNHPKDDDPDVIEAMEKVSDILDMGSEKKEVAKIIETSDKITTDAEKDINKVESEVNEMAKITEQQLLNEIKELGTGKEARIAIAKKYGMSEHSIDCNLSNLRKAGKLEATDSIKPDNKASNDEEPKATKSEKLAEIEEKEQLEKDRKAALDLSKTIAAKPSLLSVAEMQLVLTGLDNTYTLTKEKIKMDIDGDIYEITNEEDFQTYQQNVVEYYTRLLDECREAYEEWISKCKKAV